MKKKKLIAVTGRKGISGVVAKTLQQNGRFDIRIVCSEPVEDLNANIGFAVSEVAIVNEWNTENLATAFEGADAVFGSTSDGEYGAEEFQRGKCIIDAARKAKTAHLVLETQPGYHAISNGVFRVPSFDMKAALEQYCRLAGLPATYVQPAFYYENFLSKETFRISETGELYFGFPQGRTALSMASVNDAGPLVEMIFRFPKQYIGRTVGIVGDEQSCTTYGSILSEMLKKSICYRNMSNAEFVSIGGTVEHADMFDVQRIFIRSRQRDLIESYGLNPGMQPFRRWVKRNKTALLQVIDSLGTSAIS